ncbi:MAG: type IIL restriction-modification enzyme MmeI, partial [Planctomycetota bacterium]
MARLSLSEIRNNAIEFSAEWKDATSERAEAQSFWRDFFMVFGIQRRSVATFEEPVKNLGGAYDRIDVFYKKKMLGEHKSRGQDLSKADSQAFNYAQSLVREDRKDEAPRYIVVSDFARFVIYDLESEDPTEPTATIATSELHKNIKHFGFLSGYETRSLESEDEINVQAVEVLGALHDGLADGGFEGHDLERFLVRVLFCLFAEDTGIFDPNAFRIIIENSKSDGSNLGPNLAQMFRVLDKPQDKRQTRLPEELKTLPWVNGELFSEKLEFAAFDGPMREALIKCCNFDWSRISPAVFGSLFQSIMSGDTGSKKRREVGAHYTSERDILKVIDSLFLDQLKEELDRCGSVKLKLSAFHDKLAGLNFLDPACGCGNFLVVTYRELRLL